MPKKVLIALMPQMLETIDALAKEERRTRSDLIREACRHYMSRAEERKARMKNTGVINEVSLSTPLS